MTSMEFVIYFNNGANPYFMNNVSVPVARRALRWQVKHNKHLIAYITVVGGE